MTPITELDFVKATGFLNGMTDADDDYAMYATCSEHDVVTTHDTVDEVFKARGTPKRIDTASTPWGTIYSWPMVQFGKGKCRGTLYLLDAGDRRLSFFSGDV